MTHTIYDGDLIEVGIRPLAPGQKDRLVVVVTANSVNDASADGTNVALAKLTQLHYEVTEAIEALAGERAGIANLSGRAGLDDHWRTGG